ncbi:MAG: cyclic nucleotide-binding domain-containing protein, partial [Cyclobacteriaceae bacterium]
IAPHDIAVFLRNIQFFSELSKRSLEEISMRATQLTFHPREQVFEKGDPGDALYAIFSGSVSVHDDDYQYGILKTGDCFGEYAMIDREARSASVTAKEKTVVFRIGNDDFVDLMANEPGFIRGILKVLIDRHRELDIAQEELASSKQALEAANEQMKGLIEGAMDIILLFDHKFRILLGTGCGLN